MGTSSGSKPPTLDSLPVEIFLHICTFLKAHFVIHVLAQVCRRFHAILHEDATWRARMFSRFDPSLKYPALEPKDGVFDWKTACMEREEHHSAWANSAAAMRFILMPHAHFAVVDVVHLLEEGRLCVSGARDHSLKLWDITRLAGGTSDHVSALRAIKPEAHVGWIWSIVQGGNAGPLYTGSWDNTVKSWDLQQNCELISTYKFHSAILCLDYQSNLLALGTYGRSVSLIDPRLPSSSDDVAIIQQHSCHGSAVLCLALSTDGNHLISGSEDSTVVVFDRRANKLLAKVKLSSFPMCLSYGYDQLWLGDKRGSLHLLDPLNRFSLVRTYPNIHSGKITGLSHSLGSIITSSTDKTIQISDLTDPPHLMTTLQLSSEVSRISSYQTTLVSANSDASIGIWVPRSDLSDLEDEENGQ